MLIEQNYRTMISGVTGTGKSHLSAWTLSYYIRRNKRTFYVFLAEKQGDFDNPNHPPGMRLSTLGFKRLVYGREYAGRTWNWEKVLRRWPRLYVQVGDILPEEITPLVDGLSAAFVRLGAGVFVVDEAWMMLSRERKPPREYMRLARAGRTRGVDLVAITQRPIDVHPNIRTQFNMLATFRLTDDRDLQWLAPKFQPFDGRDPWRVINSLQQGEYVVVDTENGEQEKTSTKGLR